MVGIAGMQRAFTYDAENRQLSATINGTPTTYTYDGNGRRVTKTLGGGATTTYVYDATGQLAAEYGGAPSGSGTTYLTKDHLGSTRLTITATGSSNCYDYFPFGGDIPAGTNGRPSCYPAAPNQADGLSIKFTSKERDPETGLDWFESRYYSSAQGRFTSPDEFKGGFLDAFTGQHAFQPGPLPYADIGDPQTLNKYAYVRNNPLRYTDPDGHCIEDLCIGEAILAYTAATAVAGGAIYYAQRLGTSIGNFFSAKRAENTGESTKAPPTDGKTAPSEEGLIGSKGTQVDSKTLGEFSGTGGRGDIRVDVENPAPGKRDGQIQVQRGEGKGKDTVLYNPRTGNFERAEGAKPSDNNKISNTELNKLQKNQDFQRALDKAKKVLGEK